jgi:hypothetical protein
LFATNSDRELISVGEIAWAHQEIAITNQRSPSSENIFSQSMLTDIRISPPLPRNCGASRGESAHSRHSLTQKTCFFSALVA